MTERAIDNVMQKLDWEPLHALADNMKRAMAIIGLTGLIAAIRA